MIVLGIADNHDAGAAVMVDGDLASAVNQERIDRVKNSGAFPWGAIDAALVVAGVSERDVDRIVVGTGFTPSAVLRAFPERHARAREEGNFSPLLHAYVLYQSALRATGLHALEIDACKALLRYRLRQRAFGNAWLELVDHHRAHAEAAYRTQGAGHCLVLTVDAMGDGTTAAVWVGQDGSLDLLWRQSGLAGVNTFYSRVTEFLGFTPNRHEGKITGLAALAEPPEPLVRHMRTRLFFRGPGFNRFARLERPDDPFWRELGRWSREEVAAAAQQVLEEAVTGFVRYWVRRSGLGQVAVAGGVFANVKLNQRVAALGEVERLWVLPHMGDGGLAVGAALGAVEAAPRAISDVFWGPGYDRWHYGKALSIAGLPRREGGVDEVARLLAAGKVVARLDGRMEWGPRALGHRSVLFRPNDPALADKVNEQLGRSEFMPFAPIVRAEDVDRYFVGVGKAAVAARFMTVCFDATAQFRRACPAAVHVDGTARPQVLDAETDPVLYALLDRVGELTGVPVLINTSFNLHEEPIVCTPNDAVRAWRAAGLDALWLGPFLVERAMATP